MGKTIIISHMDNTPQLLNNFFDSYSPSLSGNLRENRLDRMRLLLERIGNPEKNIKMIHIAGSKGKGTTASFMAYIMTSYGMRTGLYLSPHVFDIRERFTLSTEFFSDELYLSTLDELKNRIEGFSLPFDLGPEKPTTFELYTAYAYLIFKNAGCDYGVIETGLGGRLDATNTIDPIAACFTYIEKEHTKILGSTLTEIAQEKAGIMRKGVPTFSMEQQDETLDTLKREGDKLSLSLEIIKYNPDSLSSEIKDHKTTFSIGELTLSSPTGFTDVELIDLNFAINVLLKLKLIEIKEKKLDLSNGFNLPGRFQLLRFKYKNKNLNFIFDGAHTTSSINHLIRNIEAYNYKPLSTLIYSTAIDKNYKEMADMLLDDFDRVIITGLGRDKKSDPSAVFDYISSKWSHKKVSLLLNEDEALEEALNTTPDKGYIVVTGSFYLVDNIFNALGRIKP